MSKKPRIVYTRSTGNNCEYNIYSVETKKCLGKIKGDNIKCYWEAFDTDKNFLMSGKRKKECMDYFREMDTKRLMAKGGGLDNRILVVLDEGNGKVINDLYTQWNNIKSDKDQANWNEKVKATTFGTYGTISIKEVLDKFEFDKSNINEVQKKDFKAELNQALKYAKGGGIDFEKLSSKVAKNYEGDKVAPKYQHEYGKRYSKAEAKEVGDKVAGKVYWQQQGRKMEDGGNTDKMNEYIRKKREDQEKEEEGKYFAPFRAFVYDGSYQFADFKTDDFHKAVKWAKETLEKQMVYRKSSENLWAIVDEFTPIEKRNNVIYAYSEVARFGEEDMKDMKFENGGSMSGGSNGFYIVLADGSKKEYAVNSITEIPNIYFAMGTNGIDKGTPMVHHDNVLTSVFYANGTPVEAMPQYAGKDYYDFKKKMADGGNVAEDEDYYRVFRNNAGKDIAVKIVKNPIFGKFDYYVDGTLRGQFDSFAQARQEVNYENFDMYKDGGNLHSSEFYAKGGVVVTSIKDIPNFNEENEAGRITYRGLGMGKLSDDFYKVAGENGTRIKVNGKEYNITMTEFNTFSRDSSGKMRIKFAAPLRKFADGGNLHSSEFYTEGGSVYPDLSLQKADVVNDSIQLNEFKIQKTKNTFTINGFEKKKITGSPDTVSILRSLWEKDTINAYEQAYVLYLNNANNIIGYYHHSSGGIAGTVMDVQMISGMALKSLAKAVIIAHNHPSENRQPSDADKSITKQLKESLKVFNIMLLDSIIITDESYFSFADEGLM